MVIRAENRQAYAHGKQGEMISLYKLNKFNYNHAHTLAASKGKQKAARCRKCSGAGRFPRPGKKSGNRPTPRNGSRKARMKFHAGPVFLLTEASSSGNLPGSRPGCRE